MHDSIFLNGEIVSATDARIPAVSGVLAGKGIFTSVAIFSGNPFLWEKHWHRLAANAATIRTDLSEHSEKSVLDALTSLCRENSVLLARARITIFDEAASPVWNFESVRKTSLLIITGNLRPISENFCVGVSPYPINSRSPLAGVKSCNYLENLLAYDEAKHRGFDEAIRVNEHGFVTSGCMANIFWLKKNILYTPSLETGCLPGTTREYVMENFECVEVEAKLEEFGSADAIFLTSAGLRVILVFQFESREFIKTDHPILSLIPTMVS